jgi:preprotein translocase subunit SecF
MEFFKKTPNIDFMGKRRIWFLISAFIVVASLLSVAIRGLNWGIDFTGGTLLEVHYAEPVDLDSVRAALDASGVGGATAQHFGSSRDVMIRLAPEEGKTEEQASTKRAQQVMAALQSKTPGAQLRRTEYVGPQVGAELAENGFLALLYTFGGILLYVALRFEWRLALGSVLALLHDPILIVGVFSLTQLEFDLTVLAAILAVIGYSINDTVVVFDRIRENFRKMRKETPEQVINASINQTLSRTLMTSVTTMIVLVAMYFLGGDMLGRFSLAIILGIIVGTYSSIYVASALALWMGVSRKDLMPVKKEDLLDQRP